MCTRPALIKEGNLQIRDMSPAVIERVIEEVQRFYLAGRRVCFVPMGLGEPLLFQDIFGLFRRIKGISKKIPIVLVTNGIALDENCSKSLITTEIDEVSVSLNATSRLSYKQHMGLDAYEEVYRHIECLIRMRNEAKKRLPSVYVQYIDYDNGPKALQKNIGSWLSIMRHNDKCYVHPIVNQAGFFAGGDKFKSNATRYPCTQPLWRVAVKVNGDIYPCDPAFYSGSKKISSLYLGNILTYNPSGDLAGAGGKGYQILQRMRRDEYSQLPECAVCNTYKIGCNPYFGMSGRFRMKGYRWL